MSAGFCCFLCARSLARLLPLCALSRAGVCTGVGALCQAALRAGAEGAEGSKVGAEGSKVGGQVVNEMSAKRGQSEKLCEL